MKRLKLPSPCSCCCDRKPPSDWKRPLGRPNHMWLRAIESDLRPLNIGPFYAWKKAALREHRHVHRYAQEEYAMKREERDMSE